MNRWLALVAVLAVVGALSPLASAQSTDTDLALTEVDPGDPAVDARRGISALVQNTGDSPVVRFTVTFYWQDTDTPVNGTEQDSTATYDGAPVGAGESVEVTFDWKPREDHAGAGHLVAVVSHDSDENADNDRAEEDTFVTLPGTETRASWGESPIEIDPGATTGLDLFVENTGNVNATMQANLSTPEALDWSFQLSPQATKLLPGEEARFVLTVQPPEDAPAGQAANASNGLDLVIQQEGYEDSERGLDEPTVPDLQVAAQRELALEVPAAEERGPGETANATLTVENLGNRPENVTLKQATTDEETADWNLTFGKPELSLAAGEAAETTVSVELPTNASAGAHTLELLAAGTEGSSPPAARGGLDVPVRQIHRVDATVDRAAIDLLPDQTGSIQLLVTNEGNGPDEIDVSAEAPSQRWEARPSPASLELAPGQQAPVDLQLRPPAGHQPETGLEISLTVSAGEATGPARQTLAVTTNVTEGAFLHLEGLPDSAKARPDVGVTVDATLVNGGNRAGNGSIDVQAPDDWEASANRDQIEGLAPGATRSLSLTVAPPEGAPPGQEAEIEVQARNTPGGPTATDTTLVRVGGPDLAVALGAVPEEVPVGDTVPLEVDVESAGLEPAPGTEVELTAIGETGRETLATWSIEELDAGETRSLTTEWNTSDWQGTVSLSASIDPGDEVAEESEANNEDRARSRVTFLELDVQTPAPRLVDPGRSVELGGSESIVVVNRGNRPAQLRLNVTDEAGWIDRAIDLAVAADDRALVDLSFPVPRPAGRIANNVTVQVDGGEASANATWPLTVRDPAPPRVTGLEADPSPEYGLATNLTLAWDDATGLAGGHVRISPADETRARELDVHVEDGKARVVWTPEAVGTHEIVPVLEDHAGNSVPGLPREVDVATPPPPSVHLDTEHAVGPGSLVPLAVDSRAPLEDLVVRRDGVNQTLAEPYRIDTTGWTEGEHELLLAFEDELGRSNTTSATLRVDATLPELVDVQLDPADPEPGDEVHARLTFDEPVASASLALSSGDQAPERVDTSRVSDTEREATFTLPVEGPVTVDVDATDRAGNEAVFASVHEAGNTRGLPAPGLLGLAITVGLAARLRARRA